MEGLPLASTPRPENGHESFWRQVYDPDCRFIMNWNQIVLLIGIFNVFIDPLFLYLPIVTSNGLAMDNERTSFILLMRMIGDSFHFLGMMLKFRTAYESPVPRIFRRRELVNDPGKIAMKYLKSIFVIDLIAILPLPQVYMWRKIPALKASMNADGAIFRTLPFIIYFQIIPRLFVMFPLRKNIIRTSGVLTKHEWSGAALYLLVYIMLSQIIGASYYMLYVDRLLECKNIVLKKEMKALNIDWDQLLTECSMTEVIQNGMFSDIYEHKIGSRSFTQRYMYCFSWGLKCLSSMAQNFNTSSAMLETAFSFFMTIFGLLLFAGLIARMQTSIQSLENNEDLQMVRQREIEEWTEQHQLPQDLKKRVRHTILAEWRATRGLDDNAIMSLLPSELECETRRHLYLELASTLPFFQKMDEQLVHYFCGYLRAFSSSKGSYIVVEGELVRRMFLISGGQLEVLFTHGECSTSPLLGSGDVCGEELLSWASSPSKSIQNLPSSNRTIKCLTDVEAFFIRAEDLKLLAVQFNNIWNFQQALRVHSP